MASSPSLQGRRPHVAVAGVGTRFPASAANVDSWPCDHGRPTAPDDGTIRRVPGSTVGYTLSQVRDLFVAPAEADRLKTRSSCDACHTGTQRAQAGDTFARQLAQVRSGQAEAERLIAEREKAGRAVDKARAALAP